MEAHRNYTVIITLNSGTQLMTREFAVSKFHAMDKAYSKFYDKQEDRTKYSVNKKLLNV